jgi:hypothetical protein
MRCTTPMPLYILPKIVCLLSSQGVGFSVIKNWLDHECKEYAERDTKGNFEIGSVVPSGRHAKKQGARRRHISDDALTFRSCSGLMSKYVMHLNLCENTKGRTRWKALGSNSIGFILLSDVPEFAID